MMHVNTCSRFKIGFAFVLVMKYFWRLRVWNIHIRYIIFKITTGKVQNRKSLRHKTSCTYGASDSHLCHVCVSLGPSPVVRSELTPTLETPPFIYCWRCRWLANKNGASDWPTSTLTLHGQTCFNLELCFLTFLFSYIIHLGNLFFLDQSLFLNSDS